jgi:hypothetical protein
MVISLGCARPVDLPPPPPMAVTGQPEGQAEAVAEPCDSELGWCDEERGLVRDALPRSLFRYGRGGPDPRSDPQSESDLGSS